MGWQLIESQSLSASAASVTFSNIPQTYKTLKIMVSARCDRSGNTGSGMSMRVNGLTTSIYSLRLIQGDGASATSSNNSSQSSITQIGVIPGTVPTTNTFANMEITVPNYTSSVNKPISSDAVMENNAATSYQNMVAALAATGSAITSITLAELNGPSNFIFGSTFTLYGLA